MKPIRKTITYLLCLIVTCTSILPSHAAQPTSIDHLNKKELTEQFANAKVIHISPDAYQKLSDTLKHQGYSVVKKTNLLALAGNNVKLKNISETHKKTPQNDCNENNLTQQSGDENSLQIMIDASSDIIKSSKNSDSNKAAILFVIVGTVVLVVWTLYAFKYIYDLSTGYRPCGRWNELTMTTSTIAANPGQHADFNGIRYTSGFREGKTDIGLSVEYGHSDILLNQTNTPALKGAYWFLGPTLRWQLNTTNNPYYFLMNFFAGSTEHSEIGIIAFANLGFRFSFQKKYQFGINWGAININVNEEEGIISESDQYHYLYGINFGFHF